MATTAQCLRALDLYEERLSGLPNVVGIGVVPAEGKKGYCVAVYVSKKVPRERLGSDELVPEQLEISGRNKKLPISIRLIEEGEFVPESP